MKGNEAKHTSEWRMTPCIDDPNGAFYIRHTDKDGTDQPVAVTRHGDEKANAAFIVKACNSHDELLAACRKALSSVETMMPWEGEQDGWKQTHDVLKAAIAKAESIHQ